MIDLPSAERERFLNAVNKIPCHSGGTRYWGQLYHSLIRTQKPKLVVETGIYAGYTTAWIALACKQVGAKFIAIDYFDPNNPNMSPIPTEEDVRKGLDECGVLENVEIVASDAMLALSNLATTGRLADLGIVVLDDLHHYHEIISRICVVWPHLKSRGLILSHDSDHKCDSVDPNHWVGVRHAFEHFSSKTGSPMINLPNDCGVAMMQKA